MVRWIAQLVAVTLCGGCYSAEPPANVTSGNASPVVPPVSVVRGLDVYELTTEEGKSLRFEGTSSGSFGPKSTRVLVGEADGLEPRVASCTGVSAANFHRDAPLGHHFQPELIDLKEAMTRTREIVEEVSYWPRCPMAYTVQDARGAIYRYCARKKGETTDPPRPSSCPS